MYPFFRYMLFRLDPEQAHSLILRMLRLAGKISPVRVALRAWFSGAGKSVQAFGLNFPNPLGLAAGYDKDGLAWRGLACLGFGYIEVGTVTHEPQEGNPRPRLFRLQEERGLINRMGFPGRGAEFVARQLSGPHPTGLILGVNLGKNKDTPLEAAAGDYLELVRTFAPLADYLVVNVSSPNTIGLRRLQARQALEELLGLIAEERQVQVSRLNRQVLMLVKLAPDLSDVELDDALEVVISTGMNGVIATNTTISRGALYASRSLWRDETGGLSGVPLRQRSTQMVRQIYQRTGGKLPIVGVGGVMSASDAKEKLDAGATLVQVYTGLVYEGPGLVKRILSGL